MFRDIYLNGIQARSGAWSERVGLILLCFGSVLLGGGLVTAPVVTVAVVSGLCIAFWTLINIRLLPFFFLIMIPLYPRVSVIRIPGIPTPIRIEDFVVLIIFAIWVCWLLMTNRLSVPRNKVVKGIGLFLTVLAISTVLGVSRGYIPWYAGLLYFARFIQMYLFYFITYSLVERKDCERYINVVFRVFLIVVLIGLLQRTGLLPRMGFLNYIWSDIYNMKEAFSIINSTFWLDYDFGAFVAFVLNFLLLMSFSEKNRQKKLWLYFLFALGLLSLMLSYARSATVGAFVSFFLILILKRRNIGEKVVLISIIVFVAVLLTPNLVSGYFNIRRLSGFDLYDPTSIAEPSIALRLTRVEESISIWRRDVFFGAGLSVSSLRGFGDWWYIRLLTESGIVGLIGFFIFQFLILRELWRAYRIEKSTFHKNFILGVFVSTIGLLFNAIFQDIYSAFKVAAFYWVLVGIATKLKANHKATVNTHLIS